MDRKRNLDYTIEKLTDWPFYTEGPAIDPLGNIFFTTLTGGKIIKIDKSNRITTWAQSRCPNGQIILKNGHHLVCDVNLKSLVHFDETGKCIKTVFNESSMVQPANCPNDLIMDTPGNIYFTDSVRETGRVYFLDSRGKQKVILDQLDYPNGIALSADEKWLFVAESYKNRIIRVNLISPGKTAEEAHVFVNLPANKSGNETDNLPDGITMDKYGNLWVAHYGMGAIQIISPEGEHLLSIDIQVPLVSNLTFSNEETLIITGGYKEPGPGAILRMKLSK